MNYHRANLPEDSDPKRGSVVPAAQAVPAARDPYNSAVGSYYGPNGYGPGYGPGADAPSNFQLDVLEYLRIIVKRRWLILSIVGAALTFAAVTTLMKTPLYTSTVRMQIDPMALSAKVTDPNATVVEDPDANFMRTQYELLRGRTMAERVASALKLGEDPTFLQPREFSTWDFVKGLFRSAQPPSNQSSKKVNYEGWAASVVLGNRSINPVIGSRLVDISYADPDPARAQKIAQGFAEAFVASNIDKRFQANSYSKVFLEDQIQQLKVRLEQSEKTLLDFGRKEEIVQTNDKTSIAETNLAAANMALGTLISERMKNEQLWKQL